MSRLPVVLLGSSAFSVVPFVQRSKLWTGTGAACQRQAPRQATFFHRCLGSRHQPSAPRVVCKSVADTSASEAQSSAAEIPANGQGFRHAVLHDFCMAIPYGATVLAAGLVSLLFGSGSKGFSFALGGACILAAAFFSLLQWRQQRPSTVFTLASAGVTAALASGFWGLVETGTAAVPNTVMFAASLAMLAFLVYNIIAGGNPPKKTTAEDNDELATAAAAS